MRILLPILAIAISACNQTAQTQQFQTIPEAEANVFPTNWRAEVVADLKETILDPKSVQSAEIAEPSLRHMGVASRYVVCYRINAKNAYGGMAGKQEYIAVFVRGKFSSSQRPIGGPMGQCAGVQYGPFPEAMKL